MPTQVEVTPSLNYTQKGRAISVDTVLGADALLLESLEGQEEIAGGFRYTLGLHGKDATIDAGKMIRTPATVHIQLGDGSERLINGLISRFKQLDQNSGLTQYEAEIRPWFWFLSLTSDFCVFQNISIPNIVKQVCKEQGFTDVTSKCIKPHPDHEYRVQYGETHLDFISRLMEEEGIFWFAEPNGKKCDLVLADDNSIAKQALKLRLSTVTQDALDDSVLESFAVRQEARPAKLTTIDYNFEKPSAPVVSQASGKTSHEVVEYPGGFTTSDVGDRLAQFRQQELCAEQVEAEGSGRCRGLKVGGKVEVANHHSKSTNGAYFVTSIWQSARLGEFRSGTGAGDFSYSSGFTAVPFDTPYRPERTTRLPKAYGYDSAVVVGPSGEEIFTDDYGRVKVQFFWDRRGKKDDKSSCWVRVSTVWAGKGWGVINTPRIGQEVLVAYLNGDPEEPMVIGRVYNAEQMPPYKLPANKTQSGIKTRSALKGTPDNFNEIRFEDKKGSEELYIHAEKNETHEVENDRNDAVGHDETAKVTHDQSLSVGHDQSVSVSNDQTISVGGNRSESVTKDETITVSGNRSKTVDKDEDITINGQRSTSVAKDETVEITGKRTQTVGKDEEITISGKREVAVEKNDQLTVKKELIIDVADKITITTGDASITMEKNGDIVIKGNNIKLDGSGKVNVKASSDIVMKGSKISQN